MPAPAKSPECLIAEDQALIGMLVEEQVEACGFSVLGPFGSCAAALASLRHATPDLAIIDYLLTDGPCVALATELKRRGVPFAVLSGYDLRPRENQSLWNDVVWLRKPTAQHALQAALRRLWSERNGCRTHTDLSFTALS
jgi:DNA-binding response OmpR family regulator